MLRSLFTGWPYPGCTNPHLAVAHALRAHSHTAALYTGSRARELINGAGFVHFSFGKALDARSKACCCRLTELEGVGSILGNFYPCYLNS
jgi:hypothetical protein